MSGVGLLTLRSENGAALADSCQRWMEVPQPEEERLLDRVRGPVLDVGCGPGRHVLALARRGIPAMGVDVTPAAVGIARSRGAMVLRRSVFDHVPGHGRWGSALLLDGNVGIGGNPALLLGRLRALLAPGGHVLAEVESEIPDSGGRRRTQTMLARLEHGARTGPWFGWTRVSIDDLAAASVEAGLLMEQPWTDGGRSFTSLLRP